MMPFVITYHEQGLKYVHLLVGPTDSNQRGSGLAKVVLSKTWPCRARHDFNTSSTHLGITFREAGPGLHPAGSKWMMFL